VHCAAGKDRTGTVVAAYRIAHQKWTNQQALAEAQQIGLHWWERGMKRYIASYTAPAIAPAPAAQLASADSLKAAPATAAATGTENH